MLLLKNILTFSNLLSNTAYIYHILIFKYILLSNIIPPLWFYFLSVVIMSKRLYWTHI